MTPRSRVAAVALTAALAAVAAEPPWVVVAGGRVAPPLVVQATAARDLRGLIAYGTQAGDIWVMDADGSYRRRLTRTGGRDYPGAWSPDGRRLAFGSERSGNFDVYVMDADGSDQRQLTHTADGEGPVAWLPDGRIVYSSFHGNRPVPDWYLMNLDGTGVRSLPQLRGAGDPIDWLAPVR
jgi:dipeptidyl aminopeptidase/acylaminoacyl peptidase